MQTDSVMPMFYTLAGLNQMLIDKNEDPGFIKMTVTNWIDGEAKFITAKDKK